jgi:hypothetical protein
MENQKKNFYPNFPKMPAKMNMPKKSGESEPGKMPDPTKWNHHIKNHLDENGNWKPKLVALGLAHWRKQNMK